jgi:hypothetical protein
MTVANPDAVESKRIKQVQENSFIKSASAKRNPGLRMLRVCVELRPLRTVSGGADSTRLSICLG